MALSPTELLAIQADANTLCDQTCTINRPTNTTGAWGENHEGFTLLAAGVPCIVMEPKGQLLSGVDGIVHEQQLVDIVIPAPPIGPVVRVNDQVIVAGQTFRIQNTDQPESFPPFTEFEATVEF